MTYNEYKGNRNDLITMYVEFAKRVATNYRHLSYNNEQGLQGEALLALCNAIDLIIETPSKHDTQIASIVAITIKRCLIEYGCKDRPIHQPRTSFNQGVGGKCPERILDTDDLSIMDTRHARPSVAANNCEINEIRDDLKLNKKQLAVSLLIQAGLSNTDIAAALDISNSYIFRLKKQIKNKYLELK